MSMQPETSVQDLESLVYPKYKLTEELYKIKNLVGYWSMQILLQERIKSISWYCLKMVIIIYYVWKSSASLVGNFAIFEYGRKFEQIINKFALCSSKNKTKYPTKSKT